MSFTPEFDHIVEGYVRKHLKHNFWKVASSMEYEDALQEARYCFFYVANKYKHVDDPGWFMSLFKRAWFTHFQDLAYKDSRYRKTVPFARLMLDDEYEIEVEPVGELDVDTSRTWLRELSAEMLEVIDLVFSAPSEIVELLMASLSKKGRRRETANAKVCKALGLPETVDVISTVARIQALA